MLTPYRKIAVMLDLDNFLPDLQALEETLSRFGLVQLRRAFVADPKVRWFYGDELRRFGYRLELCPGESRRPQEVDSLISASCLELRDLYDTLALCSNDGDFAPLLVRLGAMGKTRLVLGTSHTKALRRVADRTILVRTRSNDNPGPRPASAQGQFCSSIAGALRAEFPPGKRAVSLQDLGAVADRIARRMWQAAQPQGSAANLIGILRGRQGLTQSSLAKLVGVSATTIRRWECGESWPCPRLMHRLIHLHHGLVASHRDGYCVMSDSFDGAKGGPSATRTDSAAALAERAKGPEAQRAKCGRL